MNKFLLALFLVAVGASFLLGFENSTASHISSVDQSVDELTLEQVLIGLGESPSIHHLNQADEAKVKIGEELLFKGKSKGGKLISPFFKCTDCHSFGKEFETAVEGTPEERLTYAIKKDLPFLPGSTFWGIYNRKHWYNGDYLKKYGSIISAARDTLGSAIQVCAKYCSSGRNLEKWEEEAILHYFKKYELHIKDLNLDNATKKQIANSANLDKDAKARLLSLIDASYTKMCDATFPGALSTDKRGYGKKGNAQNGKQLFDRSCQHCHDNARVTYLSLEGDALTANMFLAHLTDYTDKSIYQIVRWGTYSKIGRKQYMPMYPTEKMSDHQIEDLVAYFRTLSNKKIND